MLRRNAPILIAVARYTVGFDNRWQESFNDLDEATAWAREVAATGRTVEVIARRFGFTRFVTAFPESERETLRTRWKRPGLFGTGLFAGGDTGGGHHHYGHAMGGHGGGHGGGH
jgi:hypothetical protein